MMTTTSLTEFRRQLRELPLRELEAKIDLYKDLKSMGTRDQVLLECYVSEIERRFLAWEACEA